MKILHVIDTTNPQSGGPVEGLKQLFSHYKKKNIFVEILSSDNKIYSKNLRNELPKIHTVGRQLFFFKYNPQLKAWLKENLKKYNLIVVHGIWLYHNFAVMNVAKKFNIPYFVFIHGAMSPWLNKFFTWKYIKKKIFYFFFQKKFLLNAKSILFTTFVEMENAKKEFDLRRVKKKIVGYGILGNQHFKKFSKKKLLGKFPQFNGKKILLYLGRIHEIKGLDILIKSFLNMHNYHNNYHLVIAGPSNKKYLSYLKSLSNENENITWFKDIYGQKKWDLFNVCDFFCQPSHHENFGIGIVEALSSKKPVIISNKVNIYKTIKKYKAGFVVNDNQNSFEKILKKIDSINNETYKKLSRSAYKCFLDEFQSENYFNNYFKYLKSNL